MNNTKPSQTDHPSVSDNTSTSHTESSNIPADDSTKTSDTSIDDEINALLSEASSETADDAGSSEPSESAASFPAVSPAHYKTDVKHYASYDKTETSGYTPETKKSLTYAARSPFGRFFLDLITLLTQPSSFWKQQANHPAAISQLFWPHLTILILLRALSIFLGGLMQKTDPMQLLVQTGTQAIFIILLILAMSLAITGLSALAGIGFHFEKALRFVGFSVTPLLVMGIVSLLPFAYVSTICDLLAMPWTFLIMGAGMIPYLKFKPENAPMQTGLICGLMLCLWGALPMLIPNLLTIRFG